MFPATCHLHCLHLFSHQYLLEGWKDQAAVGHHHPEAVEVVRDDLVFLKPFHCWLGRSRGQTLQPHPRAVGEDSLVRRLQPPRGGVTPDPHPVGGVHQASAGLEGHLVDVDEVAEVGEAAGSCKNNQRKTDTSKLCVSVEQGRVEQERNLLCAFELFIGVCFT